MRKDQEDKGTSVLLDARKKHIYILKYQSISVEKLHLVAP